MCSTAGIAARLSQAAGFRSIKVDVTFNGPRMMAMIRMKILQHQLRTISTMSMDPGFLQETPETFWDEQQRQISLRQVLSNFTERNMSVQISSGGTPK
jgi:hypothetical protein